MKLVIPGGTGQVGVVLARAFAADGHEVVVLSRRPGKALALGRSSSGMPKALAAGLPRSMALTW